MEYDLKKLVLFRPQNAMLHYYILEKHTKKLTFKNKGLGKDFSGAAEVTSILDITPLSIKLSRLLLKINQKLFSLQILHRLLFTNPEIQADIDLLCSLTNFIPSSDLKYSPSGSEIMSRRDLSRVDLLIIFSSYSKYTSSFRLCLRVSTRVNILKLWKNINFLF